MDDRAGYPALRALVALELKRVIANAGRGVVMAGVVAAVLLVSGAFTLPRLAFILAVVAGAFVMGFPMNALKDKMDGGLEFLRLLPVSPATLVMGRLLALVVVAAPVALLAAVAAAMAVPEELSGAMGPRALLGVFSGALLLFVGGGFLGTAMVLRFEAQQAKYTVLGIMGAVMVLDHFEDRLPDPLRTFLALSGHAWFLPALWAAGVVIVGVLAWIAFSLACSGIERFTPGKDRLTW